MGRRVLLLLLLLLVLMLVLVLIPAPVRRPRALLTIAIAGRRLAAALEALAQGLPHGLAKGTLR